MTEPFDPPGEPWVRVSPKLATMRRLLNIGAGAVLLVGLTVLAAMASTWAAVVVAVLGVAALGWGWVVVGRSVRSWGYAERAEDLLVTRGVLNRQLVVVPYGRMQFVDVQAGPLDQRFGIASVTLHTASTETAATIPGLPAAEAARLRDQLTEMGVSHDAGL